MFSLEFSTKFKKDIKKYSNQQKERELITSVISELENSGTVNKSYLPHRLKGDYNDCMECHVMPDLLLIWKKESKTIRLIRLGSHSELFK